MRKLITVLFAAAGLSGCVAYPVDSGPGYTAYEAPGYVYSAPAYTYSAPAYVAPAYRPRNRGQNPYGDRDRDGIPNRYDRDRDGDGVPNRYDARPMNPRWY